MAADQAAIAVLIPGRAGEVAADDAFDGQWFGAADQGRATGKSIGKIFQFAGEGVEIGRNEMVRHEVEALEPEGGQGGEHLTLPGDGIGQNAVESGQAVGGDQQGAVARGVNLADFAAAEKGPAGNLQVAHRRGFSRVERPRGQAERGSANSLEAPRDPPILLGFMEIPILLAQAAPGPEQPPMLFQFMPLIIIAVLFYFLLIRPQQKKQKEHEKLVAGVKTGDKVVTAGGIHGIVANLKETTILLKVADNVKIEVDKNSITSVSKTEAA
jgi:preprotein translocase subunit YajC